MIIVTGTKRSGTSMWMQILKAAGYAVLGEPFPRNWGDTIREANRAGFYESHLRRGIYHATNPDPRTGEYLAPERTQRTVVKVFVPGLMRTDLAFLNKVVATMRPWREYKASVERLYVMDCDNRRALRAAKGAASTSVYEPRIIPPLLEWWNQNYGLVHDARVRGYALHWVSYARVLAAPTENISRTLLWLGGGELRPAVREVHRELRTQDGAAGGTEASGVSPHVEAVIDEFYARVHEGVALDPAFTRQLRRTHALLEPDIREAQARARAANRVAARVHGEDDRFARHLKRC